HWTGTAAELRPDPAADSDLLTVLRPEYLARVKELGAHPHRSAEVHGLGTVDDPGFAGMYEAPALQVGATLRACSEVASGRRARAFNLGGGFHHAMPDRASGLCIFEDIAIGIRSLLDMDRDRRCLYVDLDAHHGDGVQAVFYEDPRVLTV